MTYYLFDIIIIAIFDVACLITGWNENKVHGKMHLLRFYFIC